MQGTKTAGDAPAKYPAAAKSASKKAAAKKTRASKSTATTQRRKPAGRHEIREAVLGAAEKLFRERSPAHVTLREVASEAGVQYSLVYRYFRTKEALIGAVFSSVVPIVRQQFEGTSADRMDLRDLQRDHRATGYARALAWAMLESKDLDLFFVDPETSQDLVTRDKTGGALAWPHSDGDIDPRVTLAAFYALVMGWDLYEPYLAKIAGLDKVDKDALIEHLARIGNGILAPVLSGEAHSSVGSDAAQPPRRRRH